MVDTAPTSMSPVEWAQREIEATNARIAQVLADRAAQEATNG